MCNRIDASWPGREDSFMEEIVEDEDDEDDEEDVNIQKLEFTDGNNEVVKIFNQKCVLCLERDSDQIFKQCSHQSICEEFYQNKGNFDILKCVNCRTEFFELYKWRQ